MKRLAWFVSVVAVARVASADTPGATRAILDELVKVDTSHGNETALLKPVQARLAAAGIKGEIVESGPGRGSYVARIKGTGAKKPLILLAHVDVVPIEGQPWTTKPFVPTEKDGYLYGRGVNDDKAMAASIIVIALELAKRPTKPSRDIIIALTAGEETGGNVGARWIVQHRKDLFGDAEIALNEGGSLLLGTDGDVRSVGIGVAEKTFQSFRLTVKGKGGHSSQPPTDGDAATTLAKALVHVGEHQFPMRLLPQVKDSLAHASQREKSPLGPALAHAVASAPKVLPADEKIIATDRTYNALLRTTCVTTMLKGSPQDNVLPTEVEAIINCRILPGETIADTQKTLTDLVKDPNVAITAYDEVGEGPMEDVTGVVPDAIHAAATKVFPTAHVVGTMSTGATDSRHLRGAGIHSYGISTSAVMLDDVRKGLVAHGPDERRLTKWIDKGTDFLRAIVDELVR
jgi:acetylornithine deacetylase/succinyl-diaminopimelate desuccinylase-like protein